MQTAEVSSLVETNGLNVITDAERKGRPRDLMWPWFASNISVFGISYGAFVLGFGPSAISALIATAVGIVLSFLLCGFVSMAGRRGGAPTLVLSRAAMGVNGNRIPALISWLLTVGWETVLVVLASQATATIFGRLGFSGGDVTKVIALVVVAAITVAAGVFGFDIIMRLQAWITLATAIGTVCYMALSADHISWHTVSALPNGGLPAAIGAMILVATGFGFGWTNCAADYSRYLPKDASAGGIIGWTTVAGSLGPVVLVAYGILLVGSNPDIAKKVNAGDPIGALTGILPTWFLIPFAIVVILGLIAGAVLDIYSSGLSLLAAGVAIPRHRAALVDGVIMVIGAVWVDFFAKSFFAPFQAFLITVGVLIAAWTGIFLADLLLRRSDYHPEDLYDPKGRYGSWPLRPLVLMALAAFIGWGLVVQSGTSWLAWQGYLLGPLGLGGRTGQWAYANLGVVAALLVGFVGTVVFGRAEVRRQEGL